MEYTLGVLLTYAVIMLGATVLMTKKENNIEKFCVGNRNIGWMVSALSIAATWIWAPALFTSTENAYTKGFAGLFWFLVPNVLCLILFIPFARKIREPNAYLAALYWDSEMFGRNTAARRERERGSQEKDYKAALLELFSDMDKNFQTKHKRYVAERYRIFFMSVSVLVDNRDCKMIYEGLMSGDPKLRTYRALYQRIYGKYAAEAKKKGGSTKWTIN